MYELASNADDAQIWLPGETTVRPGADEAIDALALDMLTHALACVGQFGDFHVALSGGRTLQPLYLRLMYDPALRAFPWRQTHLWLTSEHWRAGETKGEVLSQLHETIVAHSDIPANQVHAVDVAFPRPAQRYERTIKETLGWREKGHDRLDLSILSVGAQGRVCGLDAGAPPPSPTSSGSAALDEPLVVTTNNCDARDRRGVSMTIRMFNGSRLLAALLTSEVKARTLSRITACGQPAPGVHIPLARLAPVGGALRWYVDAAASAPIEQGLP